LGPETVEVPDVFRKPEAEAKSALEDAGFAVDIVHDKGDPVLGLVYEQSAAAGSEIEKGSTITLKVSDRRPRGRLTAAPRNGVGGIGGVEGAGGLSGAREIGRAHV